MLSIINGYDVLTLYKVYFLHPFEFVQFSLSLQSSSISLISRIILSI